MSNTSFNFAEEIEGVQHRAMDASDRRSAFELSLEQDRQCAADLDANLKGSGITATTSADHGIVGDNIAGIQAALDNGLGSVTGGDEFMSIKVRAALFSPCVCILFGVHAVVVTFHIYIVFELHDQRED